MKESPPTLSSFLSAYSLDSFRYRVIYNLPCPREFFFQHGYEGYYATLRVKKPNTIAPGGDLYPECNRWKEGWNWVLLSYPSISHSHSYIYNEYKKMKETFGSLGS